MNSTKLEFNHIIPGGIILADKKTIYGDYSPAHKCQTFGNSAKKYFLATYHDLAQTHC